MGEKIKKCSHKRQRKGILFGIPLLLFMGSIAIFSMVAWGYIKEAFYLCNFIVKDSYIPAQTSTAPGKLRFPVWGEAYGTLTISSADINCKVIFGDGDKELLRGAGHFDGSMFPGEGGNIVLAGHRETVFANLGNVKKNDDIIFNTSYGKYIYRVSQIKIVGANDLTVTAPTSKEQLTLYTCYPFHTIGNTSQRYVVMGDLVEGKSIKDIQGGGN
ncbi:MAG: class D sortase [Clostridiaceae bacterium]